MLVNVVVVVVDRLPVFSERTSTDFININMWSTSQSVYSFLDTIVFVRIETPFIEQTFTVFFGVDFSFNLTTAAVTA